jgi:DNA-binding NtrC family response regulator
MGVSTRSKKPRLETWLKSATTPVFLISGARRILFFNSGCEQLTGWRADEVVGKLVEFGSDVEPNSLRALASSICPPPDVLAGREVDVPVFLPKKAGGHTAKLLRFVPIRGERDQVTSVLGLISPIPAPPTDQPQSLALRYHAELSALRWSLRQKYGLKTVIAQSPLMRRVLEQVGLARASQVPVHFVGPRGVGKEHLARAIHLESEAPVGAFLPLDCQQSPFLLLQTLKRLLHPEAEDVPTGALRPRTLFLIDVEHLPRDIQEQLLKEYHPDNANTIRKLPLPRLISSSTELLSDAMENERLLPEFCLLLTTLTITVPSLQERGDDLIPLAQAFLESSNRGAERQLGGFADSVWPRFREYAWPGQLDELSLVVQEARERCTTPLIGLEDLPLRFRAGLEAQSIGPSQRALDELPIPPLEEHLAEIERDLIRRAMKQAKRNKTLAAKFLHLHRNALIRRIAALEMDDDE